VERAERRRPGAAAWADASLEIAGRGAVSALPRAVRPRWLPRLWGNYGIVNHPERMRRRMERLAAERPTFINVNDEAYDSWVADGTEWAHAERPNPRSLELFHATMLRLYPDPSRFELRPA
jgi:hypothetical protein